MAKEDKADETLSIEDQLASGKIPVITPVGFTEHSVKENVYAGKGMEPPQQLSVWHPSDPPA